MTIFTSPYPSVAPFPELTIAQFICSNPYNVDPNSIIIIEGGKGVGKGRRLTFQDYCDAIKTSAAGVANLFPELERGDILGVLSTNTLEMAALCIGISGAGFVPAQVNPSATPPELAHSFKLVEPLGPKVIFVHPDLIAGAQEGIKLCNFPRTPKLVSMLPSTSIPREVSFTLQDVLKSGQEKPRELAKLVKPAKDTLGMIFYSSGTTGAFKGVMLSHLNLVSNAKQIVGPSTEALGPHATMVSFLPLYHSYGLCVTMTGAPISGTKVVHLEKFDLEIFLSAIEEHRATNCNIVPPVALALAKHPIVDKYDLSSIKSFAIAAAPTKLELVNILRKRLNCAVVQGYGLTESSPGSHQLQAAEEAQDGSVGRLFPDMECRIVGTDGKDVGVNEEGEIVMRGPNIMMGYIRNPEATAATVKDGWLYTGDIGRRNEGGYYWIVDRLKELVKVRGFQVAPAELEGVLLSHPKVLDCAVHATYDDEKATEFPRAFIVVDPKLRTAETAAEIQTYVSDRVAHYKRLLGGVFFLDEIPKNGSGKILRRMLPKNPAPPAVSVAAKL
ncbi:acetyl-CoA synthetase-like protein [Meredithblackwellia eburnea MCA 4105]